jgi:uncharacterized protein (TIGR02145 family)
MMNKSKAAFAFSLLVLCACSDDDINIHLAEIQSAKELQVIACSSGNRGDYVYVKDENIEYECDGYEWVAKEEPSSSSLGKSSSDSKSKESSSSEGSSSDSDDDSSSSEAKSSSSYYYYEEEYSSSSRPTRDDFLNPDISYGEFTDSRDGQTYKTVVIGYQKWMAQNLNYETDSSFCHHCEDVGRCYTWEDAQTACPAGYHLPDSAEFKELLEMSMGKALAKYYLLSKAEWGYEDLYGFSLPTAYSYYDGKFDGASEYGVELWGSDSSTHDDGTTGLALYISKDSDYGSRISKVWTRYAFPVRCINDTLQPYGYQGEYGEFTDERDGNIYKTVDIGDQTWMAENLRYNMWSTPREADPKVGFYYEHWYQAIDTLEATCRSGYICGLPPDAFPRQGICPKGWHLPTKEEFETLLSYVRENGTDFNKDLRSIKEWPYRRYGSDIFGFGATATHQRNIVGSDQNNAACYWSASEHDESQAWALTLYPDTTKMELLSKKDNYKMTIRCLMDK